MNVQKLSNTVGGSPTASHFLALETTREGEGMLERFFRSWTLFKATRDVLRQNKALVIFSLCALLASVAVIVGFGFASSFIFFNAFHLPYYALLLSWLAFGFLFYLIQYFIIIFCNAALIEAVITRLDGSELSVANGFSVAFSRVGSIFGYSLLTATVGVVLRVIAERTGYMGKAAISFAGIAFSAAAFLVIPILVSSEVGPMEALNESARLLKKCWGENVVGNTGMGIVFLALYVLTIVFGIGAAVFVSSMANAEALVVGMITLAVCVFLVLALAHSAMQCIYSVVLYRFASDGNAENGFTPRLLQASFKRRHVMNESGRERWNI